jgi:hypothetical protein
MIYKYVNPEYLWSNYPELSVELQILLTENQYRKQMMLSHVYTAEEDFK